MPDEQPSTPVGHALVERGVPFREFRHPGPILSLEQAAKSAASNRNRWCAAFSFGWRKTIT